MLTEHNVISADICWCVDVNSIEGIIEDVDEEVELVESKFEKMDGQDDIHTAYAKL